MGRDAARRAATRLLADFPCEILCSVGFGGSLTPLLAPGAVLLGESFWEYHPHTRCLVTVPRPASPRPLGELVRHLAAAGVPAFTGSLVTTPFIIHKGREGALPRRLPRAVLDLETSSLAELAAARNLPFVGLRVITDGAEEEIPDFLAQGRKSHLEIGPLTALGWVAADPRRLGPLLRLWRRARVGAEKLAGALALLLPALK
jgi:adenosylhomocysteine nucleosidase